MIIACERCRTKFNLDASRLKRDGSKVRCSRCKAVFIAYPPHDAPAPRQGPDLPTQETFQETVALDSPVVSPDKKEPPAAGAVSEADFDKAFDESLADREGFKAVAPEDLKDLVIEREEEKPTKPGVAEAPKTEKKAGAPEQRRKRSPWIYVLLALLLLLCGSALAVYFWYPQAIPDSLSFLRPAAKPGAVDPGFRRLAFKAVTGGFLDSKAGNLFLIRGEVSNNYPQGRSFILLKASLLDEKGQALRTRTAYAGNLLTDEEIKTRPMPEIEQAMQNRAGKDNRNVNVAPGASVPFVIVFDALPGNLSEFTIEAVSSSPATR
jgi:predicted Zn finger-like uncharacterized protein